MCISRNLLALLLAGIFLGGLVGASPAAAGKRAPLGYQLMCLQQPQECRGGGETRVPATADTMAVLKRVNVRVNRSIKPTSDGAVDVWNANAREGDCEDYVLAKRRQLIKAGLPAGALRIAYVKTRDGQGHAVLVVKTGKRELVLDNLTNAIRPLSQTGYRLVSMQSADPKKWI